MHTRAAARVRSADQPNYDDQTISIADRIQEHAEEEQIRTSREIWREAGQIPDIRKREHDGYVLKGVEGRWTGSVCGGGAALALWPECRTSAQGRRVQEGRARGLFLAGAIPAKEVNALPPAASFGSPWGRAPNLGDRFARSAPAWRSPFSRPRTGV
jgi:hypothetical protein